MRKRTVLACMVGLFMVGFPLLSDAQQRPASLSEMKPTKWVTQSSGVAGEMTAETLFIFSRELKNRTGGKLELEVFPSEGLGYPQQGILKVVRDGLMQVGEAHGSASQGENPVGGVMELWGVVPWDPKSMAPRIESEKAVYPIYADLYPKKFNQYYLGAVMDDPWCCVLKKKEAKRLDDLQGLTIRVIGRHPGQVVQALKASPVTIPGSQLYEALSKGVVDACISVNSFMASYKLYETVKYGYSFNMGGSMDFYTVNKPAMDALPPDVQKMVYDSFKIAQTWRWDAIAKAYFTGRQAMEKGGVKYHDITPEDWERLSKICDPLLEGWINEARDLAPVGRELLSAARAAVKRVRGQ